MERHSRPRILNIWTVVTRVLLPCLRMSVQGMMWPCLAVKGDAMDASPGFTMATCKQCHVTELCILPLIRVPIHATAVGNLETLLTHRLLLYAREHKPNESCVIGLPPSFG